MVPEIILVVTNSLNKIRKNIVGNCACFLTRRRFAYPGRSMAPNCLLSLIPRPNDGVELKVFGQQVKCVIHGQ